MTIGGMTTVDRDACSAEWSRGRAVRLAADGLPRGNWVGRPSLPVPADIELTEQFCAEANQRLPVDRARAAATEGARAG